MDLRSQLWDYDSQVAEVEPTYAQLKVPGRTFGQARFVYGEAVRSFEDRLPR